MPLGPGSRLDAYELVSPLGAGGMGEVWLATEVRLGRKVALKLLPAELTQDPARVSRFEQEARAASVLSHPNACTILALGQTADGQHYIAMEYVEGETLRKRLAPSRLAIRESLDIGIQIASALAEAHSAGIVHRDIKPENVMVRPDGLVKVLDFGLAKLSSAHHAIQAQSTRTAFRTHAGHVVGTIAYMSPEQARAQEVDARTDIWSLGVMLYEMVAGRSPFAGQSSSDVLAAILDREPDALARFEPTVPAELQRIVTKALRKERARRYQMMTDLRLDLEALRGELQASSRESNTTAPGVPNTSSTPPRVPRQSSAEYVLSGLGRHKLSATAILLMTTALIVVAARWAGRASPPPQPPAASRGPRDLTRVTVGMGLQTDPTFSPDGRFIAYASDRSGNFDIWVQPVAGGDAVQVTRDPDAETQPAWSPDGSTIVFRSEKQGGGLYAVPALGGPWRQISAFGEQPSWSHTGKDVLFLAGATVGDGEGNMRIYQVDIQGGPPLELAASVIEDGTWKWIGEHPDGRISAVGTHGSDGEGFYTFTRDGAHLTKSDVSAAPDLINRNQYDRVRFTWNHAGTGLLVEATVNTVQNLWHVDVDPVTLAWRSAERVTTGAGDDVQVAMSSDERHIAYTQRTSSIRLWSFPIDAVHGRLEGEGQPFSDEDASAGGVDLTPDGSKAVYDVARSGRAGTEIWVTTFGGETKLAVSDGYDPKWTADGRSFAFIKFRPDAALSSLMIHEEDGRDRQVSDWSSANTRTLLPLGPVDDRSMLVAAAIPDAAPLWVWRTDVLGDSPSRVLIDRPRISVWQGRLSPNKRWLAFIQETTGSPGTPQIAIARADQGKIQTWTKPLTMLPNTDKPRWSPDGGVLYFLTRKSGFYNLGGIRFDAERGVPVGTPFELTHFNSPRLSVSPLLSRSELGVSRHRAALTMISATGSIWMLDSVDK